MGEEVGVVDRQGKRQEEETEVLAFTIKQTFSCPVVDNIFYNIIAVFCYHPLMQQILCSINHCFVYVFVFMQREFLTKF